MVVKTCCRFTSAEYFCIVETITHLIRLGMKRNAVHRDIETEYIMNKSDVETCEKQLVTSNRACTVGCDRCTDRQTSH